MRMLKKLFGSFFQRCGLRCSKCGSWKNTTSTTCTLTASESVGGILLIDPSYVKRRERVCASCSHVMSSHFAGTEPY